MMWRCLVLRSDPPGCSTFARNRLSPNGHFRARILRCDLEHIARYRMSLCGVVWRGVALHCVALRCDPSGCSTFARYRSSLTDLSAPRISFCLKSSSCDIRHRCAALCSMARGGNCVARVKPRMLPGPFCSPKFTWHLEHIVRYCVVWCCRVLHGVALRPAGPQHFRAIPFVLNRPFCALNLTMH